MKQTRIISEAESPCTCDEVALVERNLDSLQDSLKRFKLDLRNQTKPSMADHVLSVLFPDGCIEDLPRYLDQSIQRLLRIPLFILEGYSVRGPGGLAWDSGDLLPDMSELAGETGDHDFVVQRANFRAMHDFYKSSRYSGTTWEQQARIFERDIFETIAPLWRREMAPGGSRVEFNFSLPDRFGDDCVYFVHGSSLSPPEEPLERIACTYSGVRGIWVNLFNLRVRCRIKAQAPLILQVMTPPSPFDTILTLRTLAGSPIYLDLAPRQALTATPRQLCEAAQRAHVHPPLNNVALIAPRGIRLRCDDDKPFFDQWEALRNRPRQRRPAMCSKERVRQFPERRRAMLLTRSLTDAVSGLSR